METYLHEKDYEIFRDHSDHAGKVVLIDCDGEVRFVFENSFTDAQVKQAVAFANRAYADGHKAGAVTKALEIRRALDL